MPRKLKEILDPSELKARRMFCTGIDEWAILVVCDFGGPKPLDSEGTRLRREISAELRRRGLGDCFNVERQRGKRLRQERVLLRVRPPGGKALEQWLMAVNAVLADTSPLVCEGKPRTPEKQPKRHVNRRRAFSY